MNSLQIFSGSFAPHTAESSKTHVETEIFGCGAHIEREPTRDTFRNPVSDAMLETFTEDPRSGDELTFRYFES